MACKFYIYIVYTPTSYQNNNTFSMYLLYYSLLICLYYMYLCHTKKYTAKNINYILLK